MMMGNRRSSGADITAIGATVTTMASGGTAYTVLSWPTPGSYSLVAEADIAAQIDALIVGPGGPGRGSGGGAGGFRTHSRESLDAGTYPIVVGAGGAATYDGFKWTITTPISSALGVESACGGAGAQMGGSTSFAGDSGASGGGGWRNGVGGAGNTPAVSPAQGYAGGGATTTNRSAGGGGAGGTPAISGVNGSPGGAPAYSDITGTNTAYAQGGIGYAEAGVAPAAPTLPGSGGGGQLSNSDSLPGRAGIVIVRIPSAALGVITT